MHDNAGNYPELGVKCTGLEANYQSARLDRGVVHGGGVTVAGVRDSAAHNTGKEPTTGQSWAAHP